MIYWATWGFAYVMLWVMLRDPQRDKLYCLLAVLAMGALAVLRGRVGTDTAAYEVLSSLIRQQGIFSVGVEPGFAALFLAFQEMGLNDVLVVRLLAILDVVLLSIYVRRSTRDERYFLLTVFLPAFFYGYAMNELRIGLVSIAFLLILQWVVAKKALHWYHGAAAAAAALFHYSAVFYPMFFWAIVGKWTRRLVFRMGLALIVCILIAWLLTPAHFIEKIRLYQNYPAPSRLSGLSSVVHGPAP